MAFPRITPAPFAPSPLANKNQPTTPYPLLTTRTRHLSLTPHIPRTPSTQTTLSQPLPWLWQCHLCHRSYALAVTRRCLDDGHYFCAGEPKVTTGRRRRGARRKCGKPCASEFDYSGWKGWGRWRRVDVGDQVAMTMMSGMTRFEKERRNSMLTICEELTSPGSDVNVDIETGKQGDGRKNCWRDCDYPSECRWGREAQMQREKEERALREEAQMAQLRTWLRRQSDEAGARDIEDMLEASVVDEDDDQDEDEDFDMDSELDLGGGRTDIQDPKGVPYGVLEQMRICGYEGKSLMANRCMWSMMMTRVRQSPGDEIPSSYST